MPHSDQAHGPLLPVTPERGDRHENQCQKHIERAQAADFGQRKEVNNGGLPKKPFETGQSSVAMTQEVFLV